MQIIASEQNIFESSKRRFLLTTTASYHFDSILIMLSICFLILCNSKKDNNGNFATFWSDFTIKMVISLL